MQYRLEGNKILLVLEKGDEILQSIYTVINETNTKFGWINGIGAAENITLGAYPLKLKDYIKYHLEDKYLESSDEDDFIALQTYTIVRMPNDAGEVGRVPGKVEGAEVSPWISPGKGVRREDSN